MLRPGDVVVPVLGGGSVVRAVDEATAGAVLGPNLQLLRPDPAVPDPWFLAGFLRGTADNRRAGSHASTATHPPPRIHRHASTATRPPPRVHRHVSTATCPPPRASNARRIRLPRLPLDEQRRYGEQFRDLAAFEDALRTAGRLGGLLVQGMDDGLTDGTVAPERREPPPLCTTLERPSAWVYTLAPHIGPSLLGSGTCTATAIRRSSPRRVRPRRR